MLVSNNFVSLLSGLYYKHTTIVNYASSVVNKLEALLTDDARVVIYDRHVFIVQATEVHLIKLFFFLFIEDAEENSQIY